MIIDMQWLTELGVSHLFCISSLQTPLHAVWGTYVLSCCSG
jgi:hypothetical protein